MGRAFWRFAIGVTTVFGAALLLCAPQRLASACVGKVLAIGVVNTPRETVYADLISQLVTERTGTTVKVLPYGDVRELYAAVKKGEVGIIIENTDRGLSQVGKRASGSGRAVYDLLKQEYRRSLNLVWLDPVAGDGGSRYYAPVIAAETMGNLPALPKLINRLTGALTEESYARLVREAKGEEKSRRLAREFLKAKKLI
jgi:glycine betaine/choline ABC-type transport system substrate-binding protein